jgi:hypothetical protein
MVRLVEEMGTEDCGVFGVGTMLCRENRSIGKLGQLVSRGYRKGGRGRNEPWAV